MGQYINPQDTTKERWLFLHGEPTEGPCEITESHLPVVLVNNGLFTAAGVCPHPQEVAAFVRPDDLRPKQWFRVKIEDLEKVGAI